MYCDYHTHTPLCLHASGTPQEYVQAAVDRKSTRLNSSHIL